MKSLEIKKGEKARSFNETDFFTKPNVLAQLPIPIINLGFSGTFKGGLPSGITVFAGDSKTFKSLLSFLCLKSYLDKYDDAIGIVYDSEFGVTPAYLQSLGIDPSRVLHEPIDTIENLKFNVVNRLQEIKKGDHVFFLIDSLGFLPSNKELQDAINLNEAADMTRAKAIRSFFRTTTISFSLKDIPCVIVNHVYETMETYSKKIVSGGKSVMLAANQVFIITKEQETEGEGKDKELKGWTFKLNVEKSRFVREKSQFCFTVLFDYGIEYASGLFELAQEAGIITSEKKGWYKINGSEDSFRRSQIEDDIDFWEKLVYDDKFNQFVEDKYMLKGKIVNNDNDEDDQD